MKAGFVGFGRMGSALVQGSVEAGVLNPKHITVYDTDPSATKKAHAYRVARSVAEVVESADLIFLCVKPQVMETVLSELRPLLGTADSRKKCFVSIAAGITLEKLQKGLGTGVPVIRVMPNTPALLNAGMSVMSPGTFANSSHLRRANAVLAAVGEVVTAPEKVLDAVTAVSGSGPAYVFLLIECLAKAGIAAGLPAELATRLARATVSGAGELARLSSESAEVLRQNVTSPGGTTRAALDVLMAPDGLEALVTKAVAAAATRSRELAE